MNSVRHNEMAVSVDDRTMEQLGLQRGQCVDEVTLCRIIEYNYAWCVADIELKKAARGR